MRLSNLTKICSYAPKSECHLSKFTNGDHITILHLYYIGLTFASKKGGEGFLRGIHSKTQSLLQKAFKKSFF